MISDEKQRIRNSIIPIFSCEAEERLIFDAAFGRVQITQGVEKYDDCASINIEGQLTLVIGSDYIRGPKFILYEEGLLSNYNLGYFLTVANISDIAAMGALPFGILTIVRYPPDMNDSDFQQVLLGIRDAAKEYEVIVLGGDTGGAERLILSATAMGICPLEHQLTRNNVQVGDVVYLTGPIGTAGAAVLYFTHLVHTGKSLSNRLQEKLLQAWRKPEARVAQGRLLASQEYRISCQDISDGLKATLEEMAEINHLGFMVNENALPIQLPVQSVAKLANIDSTGLAVSASVDFELLFTVSEENCRSCEKAFNAAGFELYQIGTVIEKKGVYLQRNTGHVEVMPGMSWRHQTGSVAENILATLK